MGLDWQHRRRTTFPGARRGRGHDPRPGAPPSEALNNAVHTYTVTSKFTGNTGVTTHGTSAPPATVNFFATDFSGTCDGINSGGFTGNDCFWQADMIISCTFMSNFFSQHPTGGVGSPPFISSIQPGSAAAGSTVSVSINGGNFGFSPGVLILDETGAAAPISVSNVVRQSAALITATFTIAPNTPSAPYDVFVNIPSQEGAEPVTNPVTFIVTPATCAVPTNFRRVNWTGLPDGTIFIQYTWDSSTGKRADLAACAIAEIVNYPGTSNPYEWPRPPFGDSSRNPTSLGGRGSNSTFTDQHFPPKQWVKPYIPAAFDANQTYQYVCPCANGGNQVPLASYKITRAVKTNPDSTFRYEVTKSSGESNTLNPLP